MQITFTEVLGLTGTMISVMTGIAIMIYRFTRLEGCVGSLEGRIGGLEGRIGSLEEKVDQILFYLAPKFRHKKKKHIYRKR